MKMNIFLAIAFTGVSLATSAQTVLIKKLDRYSTACTQEYSQISTDRRSQLTALADQIVQTRLKDGKANVVFLGKEEAGHSQLSQAWMEVALSKYNLKNIQVFSAAQEASALSPKVVQNLKAAGFHVSTALQPDKNPKYLVKYDWNANALLMFSKTIRNYQIPTASVISVETGMTSSATTDAASTIALPFSDTEESRQVAREMFFVAEAIQNSHLLSAIK